MNWIQFAGALGLGAVLTKLLDIFWLERISRESERRKWLRDQRLAAYSELARDFLSFGFSRGRQFDNPFEAYAVASRAMLLADDDGLAKEIDNFIVDLDRFNRVQDRKESQNHAELDRLYQQLWKASREIITKLRTSLVQD